MCGLAGIWGGDDEPRRKRVEEMVAAIAHRGPDHSSVFEAGTCALGHARLSIVDPDERSNQPFRYPANAVGGITLAFVGEVWNHKELRRELEAEGLAFSTESDTEVLAAALYLWDDAAVSRFNGMFAVAYHRGGPFGEPPRCVTLARDRYGEVPLHVITGSGSKGGPYLFASEMKAFPRRSRGASVPVPPGELVKLSDGGVTREPYCSTVPIPNPDVGMDGAASGVYNALWAGCHERVMSDVPVCTLLSGGIDSAAIAAFLKADIPDLVAYTAVLNPKSRDLRMARLTAEALGIELVEVKVPEPTADDLAGVVRAIELPHKAQVEIGWACLKLAERMNADGFRVTYSGEGSDELWGSYAFTYHALVAGADWHGYRHGLFTDQHRKNFARANKAFMTRGVECRLPFLSPPLVDYALSLPEGAVRDGKSKPKAVLQRAMDGRLPDEVVWRPKVAFQDGMGLKEAAARAVSNPKRFYNAEYASFTKPTAKRKKGVA